MQSYAAVARFGTWLNLVPWRLDQPTSECERLVHNIPILEQFEAIGLAQMDAVALMDRIDTKYVLSLSQLPTVLAALIDDYQVLQVEGVRLNRYRTLYFDTPNLDLYTSHHVGRPERYKVRSRAYLDSGVAFLEVKHKTAKGRTIKDRIRTETLLTHLTPEASQFVESLTPACVHPLQPVLWNEFSRITLVSKRRAERATLDVNVRYRAGDSRAVLSGVVVAEIKQESVNRDSELVFQMRALSLHPTSLSKYCIGMAMLYPGVKHNLFKPVLREIENVMRGNHG